MFAFCIKRVKSVLASVSLDFLKLCQRKKTSLDSYFLHKENNPDRGTHVIFRLLFDKDASGKIRGTKKVFEN